MAKKNNQQPQSKNMNDRPENGDNVKPPIESTKDMRFQQKNGGRSTPNKADAPDGISGNWQ